MSFSSATEIDVAGLPEPADSPVDFVRDIRPILEENCYSCHGPNRQESDMRWDVKAAALNGGQSGPAVIPGESRNSLMIHLVSGLVEDKLMPQEGDPLSAEQIGLLRGWIDQGAEWPDGIDEVDLSDDRDHWAFIPPVRPALPETEAPNWSRNAIDTFVLARLEREGLAPSPEADRTTLIRRLSLDLTGLPPTIEEVDDFLADDSPEAYAKVVERLLASPHYGERWARHWLDLASYADTKGYEKDLPRSIWPYRDWVINAFNRDLPYDQFAIEQIAGDLLPDPTLDQKVATGFLRNTLLNEEGGVDPEQFRVESIMHRVQTVGQAFLGLTLQCAQCHNHKYDPVSIREYYRFYSFLNNDDEPDIEVPWPEQQDERAEILAEIGRIVDNLLEEDPALPTKQAEWEREAGEEEDEWIVLEPDSWFASVGTKLDKMPDGSLLATGSNPPVSAYTVTVETDIQDITGFRLEALTDPNLPLGGPGRSENGNFVLTGFSVKASQGDELDTETEIALQNPSTDFIQKDFSIAGTLDDENNTGWAIDAGAKWRNQDRKIVFETVENTGSERGTTLTFRLSQRYGGEHALGRFRLSATTAERPLKADSLPARTRQLLAIPADARTSEQQREILLGWIMTDERFTGEKQAIEELAAQWPKAPTSLALSWRDEHPRTTHVLMRGEYGSNGPVVEPGVPEILHPLPEDSNGGQPRSRLTLARWLVDENSPTTARVAVNRVWQHYFGRGLVATPGDFGLMGEKPSHPELLDWLAIEFMGNGWSLKDLHRLIVDSATYRQASNVTSEQLERDPYNRLLGRGSRFRVEAEIVRDIALKASGLLTPAIGGPSVHPPIPEGVMNLAWGNPEWPTNTGEDRYRRGLYTFLKRSVLYPGMTVFDAPSADVACVERERSNTPLQALTTLNDTVFHEAAQAMGLRIYREGGDNDRSRAVFGFRLATGRIPTENEIEALLALLHDQARHFEDRTASAITVGVTDPENLPREVNLHQVAAWTMVARVLINLDETITRE
ncbi:MAG: PSD1 and planctomycete cytochrome C domain-containing protein [Opitutales bacterium]